MLSTFVFAHLNSQVEQLLDVEHIPFLLELPPYICIYHLKILHFFIWGEGGWGVVRTNEKKIIVKREENTNLSKV